VGSYIKGGNGGLRFGTLTRHADRVCAGLPNRHDSHFGCAE
jgi:hypothetical protein